MYPILRLPRVASNSRNDEFCLTVPVPHTEIATAFSKPRNDEFVCTVIARSKATKQSTTTNNKHKNRKEKEFHELLIISHTEIATGFSSPRNDGVGVLSLRRPKACGNPQITSSSSFYKKRIYILCPIYNWERQNPILFTSLRKGERRNSFFPPPFVKAKATKSQGVEKI